MKAESNTEEAYVFFYPIVYINDAYAVFEL